MSEYPPPHFSVEDELDKLYNRRTLLDRLIEDLELYSESGPGALRIGAKGVFLLRDGDRMVS